MLELPNIAIGSIVAAFITGVISLLGLLISKEHKTSEFRQAWIDALRDEISSLIAHVVAIHGAAAACFPSPQETWEAAKDDFVGINRAITTIKLRLNPNEDKCKAILKSIESLDVLLRPDQPLNYKDIDVVINSLVADTQVLLKKEWCRVRSGEPVFRIAKILTFAFIVVCIIVLGFGLSKSPVLISPSSEPAKATLLPSADVKRLGDVNH